MALYDRLLHAAEPTISCHQFCSMAAERLRGKVTQQAIVDAFRLDAGEQAELSTLLGRLLVEKSIAPIPFGGYAVLTNVGTSYDAIGPSKGLGFVDLDMTGITSLVFAVRSNKVGVGTISWQLWNDTDSAELGRIDDGALAGDNRNASVTISNLSLTGIKRLRVRCKSTTATDDPVFYGATITPTFNRLTWVELEDVLVLGQQKVPPYHTVAAVKTRLGV